MTLVFGIVVVIALVYAVAWYFDDVEARMAEEWEAAEAPYDWAVEPAAEDAGKRTRERES